MSSRTFDDIVRECLQEKAAVLNTARGKSVGAKIDIYANAWVALNAWLESRLAQQKGACISGFATFCWEMLEKDGETHCRPLFLLDDTFVKVHRVKRKRIHYPPQLTPVEDINYSLLAIKFSKSLTKDMVFNGIRDLLRKIGDFISRGDQLEIEFTFGYLSAKENRVKFTFNQQRLADILPENIELGVYRHTDKPLKYIETELLTERSESMRPTTAPSTHGFNSSRVEEKKKPTIPSLDLTQKGKKNPLPPLPNKSQGLSKSLSLQTLAQIADHSPSNFESPQPISFQQTNTEGLNTLSRQLDSPAVASEPATVFDPYNTSINTSSQPVTPNPELRAVLDAIANRQSTLGKEEFRKRAKDRVIAQAFTRCLDEIEGEAKTEDFRRYQERKLYEAWRAQENQKKEQHFEKSKLLKDSLDQQLEFSRTKQQQEKDELKNTGAKFILPDTAGTVPIPLEYENGVPVDRRKIISKELRQQIEKNLLLNKQQRQQSMQQERAQINQLVAENELQSMLERADHLNKQKALLEAWEQDGHIRNLKKLQVFGKELVTDYIDRNLVEINTNLHNFGPSLNSSLNMSIGYDPRKGKL